MSLQTLSEWLRCPNCFLPLTPAGPLTLRCGAGHSFDANKRGYVSLAGGARRLIGDSVAMVDARALFLETGWYEPLRHRLAERVAAENPSRVLDIGCGTGYYLRGVLALCPDARALGMDLSPVAVGRTVSGQDNVDGLVADVWSPLPVRDASADVLLNVFAPRNPSEFHRVLREDGLLIVVVPQASHLQELRASGLALDVPANKGKHLSEALSPAFELETRDELSSSLRLNPAQASALIGMGPSAHHTDVDALTHQLSGVQTVTASFELLGYRRITI
ncbi:methyltransferase domain-containing protein [Cryobacterium sp. TMT2-18-3]|uniref:methyltransferase domain-containing protein n=2 Tax=Cryobacterium TaxID=69578 RepID=UPI00106D5299|nr:MULTISPECIES: methyltransferase domain-containing protein [unclassified Cryobacterium]TFC27899.1 methyltransferase domain-containing protein [Cryobacterium sp. TMT2-18-2]TFC63221.1 methyltransferase domain-containing protein [Cryobacterium sp. TMT2-18-3]